QTSSLIKNVNANKCFSKGKFKKYLPLFLMMLPGLFYLLVNNYLPMGGLVIAFKDVNFAKGIWSSDWVGFENFKYLFATRDAFIITRNTIAYNLVFIILGNIINITIAILLSEISKRFFANIYQTIILLPHMISWVIVSYIIYAFLDVNGIMNNTILPAMGFESISWYMRAELWPYIIILVSFWKNMGFGVIVYLASIFSIDNSYYEAAELDGATKWQQIKNITLPLLKPTVILLVMLALGRMFYADFGLFYQVPLDSGMLYETTNVIDTYVFRALLQRNDIGMASAAGFYQSIVGFILVMTANFVIRKISRENALF
ncbi:MAG TPA: ABC transporter permease subunit, partial [Halanaerobiales bacterium]|nr:ABC transporter permease subunit [Halanaerobiales bacterium]